MTLRDMGISVLIALLVIAGGYLGWRLLQQAVNPVPPNPVEAHMSVSQSFADFGAAVRQARTIHEILNNLVCWGNAEYADPSWWAALPRQVALIEARINELNSAGGTPELQEDLANIRVLLNIGLEKREREALFFAHRIIHDLDYYVFKSPESQNEPSDYWRATVTLEGTRNRVQQWLQRQSN